MLINDLITIIEKEIKLINKETGYKITKNIKKNNNDYLYAEDLLKEYFTFIFKTIPTNTPCKLKKSNEIKKSIKNLSPKYKKYYNNICKLIKKGEDIKPYQSRYIDDIEKTDYLFYTWNINHLHLSSEKSIYNKNHYLKNNSDYILFFIYKKNTVYLIDIVKHPYKDEWLKNDILEIATKNWPKLYEKNKLQSINNNPINNNKNYYELTRAKIITTIESNNNLYIPYFGGLSTNGTPLSIMTNIDFILINIEKKTNLD